MMFKKLLLISFTICALITILIPHIVFADTPAPAPERVCQEVPLPNLPGLAADPCSSPAAYIQYWFYFALYLAGIAALLMLVAGGVMYMLSSTIPGAGKGTKYITNASLGFILLFGSYLLLRTLGGEQFITLKNPQLPKLPTCSIGFKSLPLQVNEKSTIFWDISTENADYATASCAGIGSIATPGLTGETTITPLSIGIMACTFNIWDKKNIHLKTCTVTSEVVPFFCSLSFDPAKAFFQFNTIKWKTSEETTKGILSCKSSTLECTGQGPGQSCEVIKSVGRESSIRLKTERKTYKDRCTLQVTPQNLSCSVSFLAPKK